ncbi:acyl carrier protein [Chitinophaga sp. 30R24]|uniref:acyl carrier protein n=1 Tax=Chitinophaga sp. 30R24 TaxID=3248838 RepID=UPI003B8ED7A2
MNNSQKLFEVMAVALSIPVDTVTDDMAYQGIPEWDSMTHLEVVAGIEQAFSIGIDMEDVLEMGSVGKIKTLLQKYNVVFAS